MMMSLRCGFRHDHPVGHRSIQKKKIFAQPPRGYGGWHYFHLTNRMKLLLRIYISRRAGGAGRNDNFTTCFSCSYRSNGRNQSSFIISVSCIELLYKWTCVLSRRRSIVYGFDIVLMWCLFTHVYGMLLFDILTLHYTRYSRCLCVSIT